MEEPATKQETVEGMGEMPEIIVVSDAVLTVNQCNSRPPSKLRMCLNFGKETSDVGRLVLHKRVQQRSAEETLDMGRLVLHERVQQRSAEEIEVVPETPEETVEILRLVSRERAQQRTVDAPRPQDKDVFPMRVSERIFEQSGVIEVPETASQDQRSQRTVVQYLDVSAKVDKNVLQERISEKMRDQIKREHLQCYCNLWGLGCMLSCADRVLAALR